MLVGTVQLLACVADRECDPDLCKPCQWTICRHKPAGSTDCQNMALRMRQHKRVAMGLSHVAGWGAFAQVCHSSLTHVTGLP